MAFHLGLADERAHKKLKACFVCKGQCPVVPVFTILLTE